MGRNKALRAGHAGFTLYELMFVVAIVAVGIGLAVPQMRTFLWNSRMSAAANDMLTAMYRARSESVKRHGQTIMCFSDNPTAATPACGGTGRLGWVAFADTDSNGQVDAGEDVFLRHGPLPTGVDLKATPAGTARYLAFNSAGFARDIALGTDLSGIVLCDSRGNKRLTSDEYSAARGVTISVTGRARVTRRVKDIDGTDDPNLAGCP